MTQELAADSANQVLDSLSPRALAELRKATKERAQVYLSGLLDEYMMDLRTDGDVEDKRKAVDLLLGFVGWREPPPKDATANLPTTNINIDLSGAREGMIRVELSPTPAMSSAIGVNKDIVDVDD